MSLEIFGKIENGKMFTCSKDSEILESEWLLEHDGKLVRKRWSVGKPSKTTQQIRYIYKLIAMYGAEEGYADLADLKRDIKESIGYFETKGTKDLRTGVIDVKKEYKSFADLKRDDGTIDKILTLFDEIGYPARALYIQYMGGNDAGD
jgi:hypothetical protein